MVNNNLMIFEGHDVEVFELNGQALFNPKHVAEWRLRMLKAVHEILTINS